jgi:hypothetical protein
VGREHGDGADRSCTVEGGGEGRVVIPCWLVVMQQTPVGAVACGPRNCIGMPTRR